MLVYESWRWLCIHLDFLCVSVCEQDPNKLRMNFELAMNDRL